VSPRSHSLCFVGTRSTRTRLRARTHTHTHTHTHTRTHTLAHQVPNVRAARLGLQVEALLSATLTYTPDMGWQSSGEAECVLVVLGVVARCWACMSCSAGLCCAMVWCGVLWCGAVWCVCPQRARLYRAHRPRTSAHTHTPRHTPRNHANTCTAALYRCVL
jgi:hypothetical protein